MLWVGTTPEGDDILRLLNVGIGFIMDVGGRIPEEERRIGKPSFLSSKAFKVEFILISNLSGVRAFRLKRLDLAPACLAVA